MPKDPLGSRPGRGRHRLGPLIVAALVGAATVAATGAAQADPVRIDIAMRKQEKTNWCWAAAGSTIARQLGADRAQNAFCNAAFDRRQGTECPNDQADLGNVQRALRWAGIAPGKYVTGWLRYSTVKTEIDAGRPVETRVLWTSGGGHMHVVYGYDEAKQWVYWGDPWPSYTRYNWGSHDYYLDNGAFRWTHSLYEIGKG
ncbi:papain-like cysteine protease family protein [Streptomyces sp. NPDC051577]|uniref:papain-like cysteine protease family protein n=1 Tax=Streptomyces sp. NPDC051577 TaxID=3155166 RepID=UPI003416B7CD